MDPEKELPGAYNYEFVGWDKDYSVIIDDLVLNPLFDAVLKTFTVYFMMVIIT